MNLKETILKHNAAQEYKDGFYSIDYANEGSHAALINEIKVLNDDLTFKYTADVSEVIQYIDDLKQSLLTYDSADKVGYIPKGITIQDRDIQRFIYKY